MITATACTPSLCPQRRPSSAVGKRHNRRRVSPRDRVAAVHERVPARHADEGPVWHRVLEGDGRGVAVEWVACDIAL
jgi:hypothetical protein